MAREPLVAGFARRNLDDEAHRAGPSIDFERLSRVPKASSVVLDDRLDIAADSQVVKRDLHLGVVDQLVLVETVIQRNERRRPTTQGAYSPPALRH